MDKYQADVLIVGAGAVGAALARELSKHSLDIIVADRLNDVGGDASKSNSAIVHTGFDAPPGTLESEMVVGSNPMWDRLCGELDIPFKRVGAILVALNEQEEAELPGIMAKARKNRVYDLDLLTSAQVRNMESDVSDAVRAGISVPRESITDPFLLVVALAENACANGVRFLVDCEINNLTADGGGYLAESDSARIRARYVVNAAGLFSDRISGFLGIHDSGCIRAEDSFISSTALPRFACNGLFFQCPPRLRRASCWLPPFMATGSAGQRRRNSKTRPTPNEQARA